MDQVSGAARSIAEALAPAPSAPDARWRWGTVAAVASDGTMTVNVGGTPLVGVRAAQHAMGAKVGDRVRVAYLGTDAMVDAVRATAKLMSLPTIDGALTATGRITGAGLTSTDEIYRTTDIDPSTAPSANKYRTIFRANDASGVIMGYMQAFHNTSDIDGVLLNAMRIVDGSAVYNGVTFGISPTGARSVNVSDASAWRTALGIGLSTADITPANATATVFRVISRLICATLTITGLQLTAALANNQSITIGTVPAGYRPSTTMWAAAMGASSSYRGVYISVASGGTVTLYNRTGASLPASSNVYATLTWTR